METEGWGKFREAVVGSEVEGLYGLLRGVTSCCCPLLSQPLVKRSHLMPSSPGSQSPTPESTAPDDPDPAGQAMVSASSAATSAPEGDIPAHMQPLRIQLGAPSKCTSARLKAAKRAHQPHGQLSAPM